MTDDRALLPFEGDDRPVRRQWHEGRWFFSVIDVVGILTDSGDPGNYWASLKRRVQDEGFIQLVTTCHRLKMRSLDGKQRETDAADVETMLRIVQSIPSPKAEPIKQFLAKAGAEKLEEIADPSQTLTRARKLYARQGYSDDWIDRRLKGQIIRDELTQEWADRGAKEGKEFAALTDTIHGGTFDVTTARHRQVKQITSRQNLRDSMTPMELALTGLAEETAKTLHQVREANGLTALHRDCEEAGEVGGAARRDVEARTGMPVVSPTNYKQLRQERQRELQPPLLGEGDGETEGGGE